MRKTYIFLIFALLTIQGINAKPVNSITARLVANTWMSAMGMKNTASLVDVTSQSPFTEFYIFASDAGGFILVSADDCVMPVLGYSVGNHFQVKEMPIHVRSFLEGYEREIRFYKELESQQPIASGSQPSAVSRQWQMLTSGEIPPMSLTTAVAPLMATTWNQAPYYNILCPYDETESGSDNHHIVTGCVATATAQVMKYHSHPATGYGSHSYTHRRYGTLSADFGSTTYQWSNMPNALNASSSEEQVNAVATLMYHIGVADEMSYDLTSNGGSGAFNYNGSGVLRASSQTSLMKYFKYRPDMAAVARDNYSDSEYCAILRTELDQSRPILYSGFGGGGHSFVLDGYNNDGLFHVNWGWGGNHDGYFVMGALNPSGGGAGSNLSGTYNNDNTALIGIRPNPDWNTATTITTAVEGCPSATVSGAGTYAFGDTVTLAVAVPEGYRFARWNDYDRFNVRQLYANGGSYSFTAIVEPVAGDIRSYCGSHCNNVTSFSYTRWGIRLPASVFASGDTLSAVQFFVTAAGAYTLTIYTGATAPTTAVYTDSHIFSTNDEEHWRTFILSTPLAVDANQNLWITFSFSGSGYPAAVTSSSGNADGFLVGSSLTASTYYNQFSAMIRGIFGNAAASVDSSSIIEAVDCSQPADLPYRLDASNPEFTRQINCWTFLDADGDGYNWFIDGPGFTSKSYTNQTDLTPDNWLISPSIALPSGCNILLSLKDAADNINWPEDHYGIFLSTSGTDTSDFTLLEGHTLSDTSWTERTVDLSAYAGQTVHIAFRHYNCSGVFMMHLKDIALTSVAPLPYATGFENGDDAAWDLAGGYNAWTLGTAASNGGSNGLYVSDDNGTSNAYTTSTSSTSFASRTFSLESGQYAFSFDWRCNGESNYDFLRVWVAPNSAALVANEFPVESSIATGTPEGWIDLVGGQLSASSTWNTASGTFSIATAGIYKLIFCWKNDGSWGNNPPAAIDNVSITALSCPSPTNLAVTDITPSSITFSWDASAGVQWLISLDGSAWQPVGTNSYSATGLAEATEHTFSVRTLCNAGDSSLVVSLSATTPCDAFTAPFGEDFENLTDLPSCWSTSGPGNWTVGTGDYSTSTGAAAGSQNIKITHSASGNVTYLITPVLNLASLSSASLSFRHVQRSWSGDIDELAVAYRPNASAEWQTLASYTAAVPSWTEEILTLPNLSATYQIAFICTDHYGYGVGLDEIHVEGSGAVQPTDFTLNATANATAMGTVAGSGTYPAGSIVTATAIPFAGHAFLGWNNGAMDNPYSFTLSTNTDLVATFSPAAADSITLVQHDTIIVNHHLHDTTIVDHYLHDTIAITDTVLVTVFDTLYLTEYIHDTVTIHDTITITIHDTVYVGIDNVTTSTAKVYPDNGQVVVEGAEGNTVSIYDISGRLLAIRRDGVSILRFDVPVSGTYLVKVGTATPRRIVVVR